VARRRRPDSGPTLEAAFERQWQEVGEACGLVSRRFAGGKSMGGRIATQALAGRLLHPSPDGVVCFRYPLHPPGRPDRVRDTHLSSLGAPVLFLHGTQDPFGTPEEMEDLAGRVAGSTLYLVDGANHSLERSADRKRSTADALAAPLDAAAAWMRRQPAL
jgi:predicted alpha/beta-hydrolase family hydrolase